MKVVIVVEDEPQIREELVDWMTFEGYHALGASNGRVALELIQSTPPDLIISDIAMPEMDGYELILEVRSNPKWVHIPFIFLTAAADRSAMRYGMTIGADDYITKPFTHTDVMTAVHTRLKKQDDLNTQVQEYVGELTSALDEERKRVKLKSRLIAMFSHDFRNPLSSILSSSNIIRNYEAKLTPERKRQHLDRIDGAVHLLSQMVDDMLTVVQMERGQLEFVPLPMNLAGFINGIVDEFRMIDNGLHTIIYKPTLTRQVNADARLIRQMVSNLLSNALKYSSQGSEVGVTLEEKEGQIFLSMSDKGIGIPADNLAQLFECFYRADNAKEIKGTGIGLCIVKECAERHGGHVSVVSEEGKGTTFTVVFVGM